MARKRSNNKRTKYHNKHLYAIPRNSSAIGFDKKDIIIEITEEVVEDIARRVQIDEPEDVGVIFGSVIEGDHIRINKLSETCALQRTKYKCILDASIANQVIKEEFEKSNQTRVFVGEWHTHPEEYPTPSYMDIRSIAKDYNDGGSGINGLILLIIGQKSNYWGYYDGKLSVVIPRIV